MTQDGWRRGLLCLVLLGALTLTLPARAYPWMVRHDYSGCIPCHADPSGAGLLTEYGRAQGDVLLRTRYTGAEQQEPSAAAGFLWGAAPLPEWLLLGGSGRYMLMHSRTDGAPSRTEFIQMVTELRAQAHSGRWRASGSLGYAHRGARPAAITRSLEDNLVSREHWVGYDVDPERGWLLRAGRVLLPFGIRTVEHTLYARTLTRSTIDADQQHGIAFAWSGESYRAEAMAILGNYQLRPDTFRERGYSALFEYALASRLALGLSSLTTYADRDLDLRVSAIRSAHGPFIRYAPWPAVVLLAEGDLLVKAPLHGQTRLGAASFVLLDFEPVQGLHAMLIGEAADTGETNEETSLAGWFSLNWFFAPHVDLRLDAIQQRRAAGMGSVEVTTLLAQLHIYL
jgi:hypothetical protein